MSEISIWSGHPLHGGEKIDGEFTEQADGTFTFRPYLLPNSTIANLYVQNEDGSHFEIWRATQPVGVSDTQENQ